MHALAPRAPSSALTTAFAAAYSVALAASPALPFYVTPDTVLAATLAAAPLPSPLPYPQRTPIPPCHFATVSATIASAAASAAHVPFCAVPLVAAAPRLRHHPPHHHNCSRCHPLHCPCPHLPSRLQPNDARWQWLLASVIWHRQIGAEASSRAAELRRRHTIATATCATTPTATTCWTLLSSHACVLHEAMSGGSGFLPVSSDIAIILASEASAELAASPPLCLAAAFPSPFLLLPLATPSPHVQCLSNAAVAAAAASAIAGDCAAAGRRRRRTHTDY